MKELSSFNQMITFFLMFFNITRSVQIWVVFQAKTGRVIFFVGNSLKVVDSKIQKFS